MKRVEVLFQWNVGHHTAEELLQTRHMDGMMLNSTGLRISEWTRTVQFVFQLHIFKLLGMALQHVYLFICLFVFRYYENKLYSIDFLYLNGRWLFVKLFDGLNLKESKWRIDICEHGTAQMERDNGYDATQILQLKMTRPYVMILIHCLI